MYKSILCVFDVQKKLQSGRDIGDFNNQGRWRVDLGYSRCRGDELVGARASQRDGDLWSHISLPMESWERAPAVLTLLLPACLCGSRKQANTR